MNKLKLKKSFFIILSTLLIFLGGCDDDDEKPEPLPEILVPCDYDPGNKEVIEIKDFQTKLYYQVSWPEGVIHPGCADPPNGITCNMFPAMYYFQDPSQSSIPYTEITFCNFPEYVNNWNPRNKKTVGKNCILVEGEVDIILSGKLYVTQQSDTYLSGDFELTSLKRITK